LVPSSWCSPSPSPHSCLVSQSLEASGFTRNSWTKSSSSLILLSRRYIFGGPEKPEQKILHRSEVLLSTFDRMNFVKESIHGPFCRSKVPILGCGFLEKQDLTILSCLYSALQCCIPSLAPGSFHHYYSSPTLSCARLSNHGLLPIPASGHFDTRMNGSNSDGSTW
ncbi:hypothetical protein WG66_009630, partial [Moniliophthora roreri]